MRGGGGGKGVDEGTAARMEGGSRREWKGVEGSGREMEPDTEGQCLRNGISGKFREKGGWESGISGLQDG